MLNFLQLNLKNHKEFKELDYLLNELSSSMYSTGMSLKCSVCCSFKFPKVIGFIIISRSLEVHWWVKGAAEGHFEISFFSLFKYSCFKTEFIGEKKELQ